MDPAKLFLVAFVLVALVPLTGSMAEREPVPQIPFDAIRSAHFHAFYVSQDFRDEPARGPLALRVTPLGNLSGVDFAAAARFLRAAWDVDLVLGPGGLPIYFTDLDLVSLGDPGAVGSTVSSGIAVERGDPRLLPCTIAHEIGHAIGLGHSGDPRDIMWTRCTPGKLEGAATDPAHVDRVRHLHGITAYTLQGAETWAWRK